MLGRLHLRESRQNAVTASALWTALPDPPLPNANQELQTDMLNAIGFCAIAVSHGGKVLQTNNTADAVLKKGDALVLRKGLVGCLLPKNARHLLEAIQTTAGGRTPGAVALDRSDGRTPYYITIAPLPGTSNVLLLFRDPDMEDTSLTVRLRALFSLTMAEAQLAIALSHGASLPAIAAQRGVLGSTVRSQMKSIAAKMRCSRQAEITAIVAQLPPLGQLPE